MEGYGISGAKLSEEIGEGEVVCGCEIHPWREICVEREESVRHPGYEVENPSNRSSEGINNL